MIDLQLCMYFSCVAQRAVKFVLWSFVVFVYLNCCMEIDISCVCIQLIFLSLYIE